MFFITLILLCSFTTVSALSLQDRRGYSNVSNLYNSHCYLFEHDVPPVTSWTWLNEDYYANVENTITLSMTIVTVVNTVLDITSSLTQLPPEYTYPPTNTLGTHIETISFVQSGQDRTTVLTYPSEFIAWPDYYKWGGTLAVDTNNTCMETMAEFGATASILSAPQPSTCSQYYHGCNVLRADPRGLFHYLAVNVDVDRWAYTAYGELLTDQPALTSCLWAFVGPNWGGFTQTNWYTGHVTFYVGEDRLYPTAASFIP